MMLDKKITCKDGRLSEDHPISELLKAAEAPEGYINLMSHTGYTDLRKAENNQKLLSMYDSVRTWVKNERKHYKKGLKNLSDDGGSVLYWPELIIVGNYGLSVYGKVETKIVVKT